MSRLAPTAAKDLLAMLAKKHTEDVFVPECKTGPSPCPRMDAWAMRKSWAQPVTTGYEIKVSRSDFVGDEKWPYYLPYCSTFYFVCAPGVIAPEEVPDGCGLLVQAGSRLITKRKAPWRDVEIPEELFRYVLMARVKIVGEFEPAESRSRAYRLAKWEAWLKETEKSRELGYMVRGRISELWREQASEIRRMQAAVASYSKVDERLRELGIDARCGSWSVVSALNEALGIDPALARQLRKVAGDLQGLAERVEKKTTSGIAA